MIAVKKKIYLDSTVPNYVFNDAYPEKQKAAELLFQNAKNKEVLMFASPVTVEEVNSATEPKRGKMIDLLKLCALYEESPDAEDLARVYIARGVFTKNNLDDARHVSYAVYYSADIIASYNFSHIVRISTITQLQSVNLGLGFRTPEIRSPEELL